MTATSGVRSVSVVSGEFKEAVEIDEPTPTVDFRKPSSLFGQAMYQLTRPAALFFLYRLHFPAFLRCVSLQEVPRQSHEFMADLGGERISIITQAGTRLSAVYFNPDKFLANQEGTFKKWKERFGEAAYAKLAHTLEVDLKGNTLQELLGIPKEVAPLKTDVRGVVATQGAGQAFEFDPTGAVMFLLRGQHVLLFNYSGIMESSGSPGWEATCHDTRDACLWLKQRLDCENHHLLAHGKSMGSGPVIWTGTQLPGLHVVIDRPVASLGYALRKGCPCGLGQVGGAIADSFYRYPNAQLLPHVKGQVLIIQATEDKIVHASNAQLLFQALVSSKLKSSAGPEQLEALKRRCWLEAPGGHSSISGGDETHSWYRYTEPQTALSSFISDLRV